MGTTPRGSQNAAERESALFEAAVQLPKGPARQVFLEQAAAGDAQLRKRLDALLAAHDQPEEFLETNRASVPFSAGKEPSLGISIGRYKILEKVGEGGCGTVYVAEQTEPVRRRVALKVIKLGMDTRAVVARFEAERQALAMMDHPNIARVLDAGSTEEGRPYFVMELVRGIKITEYCDQNQLSTKDRLDLFTKVCNAIQHAHQKGIIHRDIKPSNILVTLHDGVPVPKVIDFGIAKATEGRLTDATVYTQLHHFIGTPAYMSPEQAEMSGLDVDTRSDIYSLGVLLYELLTGRTPFDAKELMDAGLDEMRRKIREKEPIRPSTRVATLNGEELTTTAKRRSVETAQLVHLLKGDLDWIVMKCLEKDRTRRYETANGVAADIRRHLTNEPVVARPPSLGYRFQKAIRRNKIAFTAGAAVAIALFVGLVVASWQAFLANRASRAARLAQQEAENLRGQEAGLRAAAEQAALRAREKEAETSLIAYASDMRVAQLALAEGHRGKTREILARYIPEKGENDLRGVEWRYLWKASEPDELATFMHPAIVPKVAISRDGRWIATSCFDRKVRLWDVASGSVVWEKPLPHPDLQAWSHVAISPFSDTLITTGSNGFSVYRLPDGELEQHEPGGYGSVYEALGVPELIVGGKGKWQFANLVAGTWEKSIPESLQRVIKLPFHSFASCGSRGGWLAITQAGLEKWAPGEDASFLPLAVTVPVALTTSKSGQWAVVGGENGEIQLIRLAERYLDSRLSKPVRAHPNWVLGLAFSPDERLLATGGNDQLIKLWELPETGEEPRLLTSLQGHENEIWWLTFAPDGEKLFSASKDSTVKAWSVARRPGRETVVTLPRLSVVGGIEANSKSIWTVSTNGVVEIWETDSGKQLKTWELPAEWPRTEGSIFPWPLNCGPGQIAAGGTNGVVWVLDLASGKVNRRLQASDRSVLVCSASESGRWLVTRSGEFKLAEEHSCWDLRSGKKFFSWPADVGLTGSAWAFASNHRWLASVGKDHEAYVFDLASGARVARLPAAGWIVSSAAFSSDSTLLAIGSEDSIIRIFSTTDWSLVRTINGHLSGVHRISFSRDGKTLIASDDHLATRFWHVATGREMLRFDNAASLARDQLSPHEDLLVTQTERTGKTVTLRRLSKDFSHKAYIFETANPR